MSSQGNRTVFYFFDSASSIRAFDRLRFPHERDGLKLTTVCVTSDDVIPASHHSDAFDHIFVLPAHPSPYDPCCLDAGAAMECVTQVCGPDFRPEAVSVVSCGEYTALVAAQVREKLGIPGPSVNEATGFRDKLRMKEVVGASVTTPKNLPFQRARFLREREAYLDHLLTELGSPFIIKPTNMASSSGVRKVHSSANAADVHAVLQQHQGEFEAEEYVVGEQYHCETLYHDGRLLASFVSRFNSSMLDMMSGRTVGSLPVPLSDPVGRKVSECSHLASLALGARNGVTHTEVMVRPDGTVVFIETASRAPGGDVVGRYVESFGVDILEIDQRIKSGVPYELAVTERNRYSFWAYVPKPDGVIADLKLPDLSSTIDVTWFVTPGERTQRSASFEEPAALLIVGGDDYSRVSADFASVLDFEFITVHAGA
ncbi:acetyl-CoA carboxylase biotin carboxylase subunit family protein [Streptomyces monticola]|uniref:Acetyl-CoA carboxylase biotin carboxylase subunit family protein n=1 Tax=Streptomyces monticola TaxID=2666263 RepID=A0ABW2JRF4_9ACTN